MPRRLPKRRLLTQARAQELRRDLTPAERLVWSIVRDGRLAGLKSRRQVASGPDLADDYCPAVKLVVELDGDSHDLRIAEDAERTRPRESLGIRVCRISNDEVLHNQENVGFAILKAAGIDLEEWCAAREPSASEWKIPSP